MRNLVHGTCMLQAFHACWPEHARYMNVMWSTCYDKMHVAVRVKFVMYARFTRLPVTSHTALTIPIYSRNRRLPGWHVLGCDHPTVSLSRQLKSNHCRGFLALSSVSVALQQLGSIPGNTRGNLAHKIAIQRKHSRQRLDLPWTILEWIHKHCSARLKIVYYCQNLEC